MSLIKNLAISFGVMMVIVLGGAALLDTGIISESAAFVLMLITISVWLFVGVPVIIIKGVKTAKQNKKTSNTQAEFIPIPDLKKKIAALEKEKTELEKTVFQTKSQLQTLTEDLNNQKTMYTSLIQQLNTMEHKEITFSPEVLVQECGLYQPRYVFAESSGYKEALQKNRDLQKQLIKEAKVFSGLHQTWFVGGSQIEGQKMVRDMKKLIVRAYNGECDEVVRHVTYLNVEASKKKIEKSYAITNKLGTVLGVEISPAYLQLKLDELALGYEYAQKKQEEKEEQREIKAQMREEARLQKEIEETLKKVRKEETHYTTALEKIEAQLSVATEEQKEELLKKKEALKNNLTEIAKNLEDIDYRQANARAGYVYIISNIGSFGENVYKIGMTRRLEPMERVDELGDASVPFKFDVHALIFADDAPKLENSLHKAFENKKVNMVNHRREFFEVTLQEIEAEVIKSHDKTVEFTKIALAEQYRQSLELRKQLGA